MGNVKNIVGKTFGKLTVIEQIGIKSICICSCGENHTAFSHNLRKLNTSQCTACYKKTISVRKTTHGQSNYQKSTSRQTKEYMTWSHIKSRCLNVNDKRYLDYGGRGICICERWKNSFENFFEDIGIAPTAKHQIDRIDNSGDYEPSNCRWSSIKEQANNKRNNIFLVLNGEEKTASEWSEILNMQSSTIIKRKKSGWTDYDCLTKPTNDKSKAKIKTPDGEFSGYQKCADYYDTSVSTIAGRVKSINFPEWIVV